MRRLGRAIDIARGAYTGNWTADFLPPLPRLERAPLPHRRPCRRGDLPCLHRAQLARAATGVARATRHTGRPPRFPHEFWCATARAGVLEIATVTPTSLTGCTAWPWPFFHPRNCCVRAAASGCACAESCGEQNAASPSPGLHRHPKGARQRRLHRGRGSGRCRRLDAPARARLDRLPASARSRAA